MNEDGSRRPTMRNVCTYTSNRGNCASGQSNCASRPNSLDATFRWYRTSASHPAAIRERSDRGSFVFVGRLVLEGRHRPRPQQTPHRPRWKSCRAYRSNAEKHTGQQWRPEMASTIPTSIRHYIRDGVRGSSVYTNQDEVAFECESGNG